MRVLPYYTSCLPCYAVQKYFLLLQITSLKLNICKAGPKLYSESKFYCTFLSRGKNTGLERFVDSLCNVSDLWGSRIFWWLIGLKVFLMFPCNVSCTTSIAVFSKGSCCSFQLGSLQSTYWVHCWGLPNHMLEVKPFTCF